MNTKEQVADIFTKALSPQAWDHALLLMGLLYPAAAAAEAPQCVEMPLRPRVETPREQYTTNNARQCMQQLYSLCFAGVGS